MTAFSKHHGGIADAFSSFSLRTSSGQVSGVAFRSNDRASHENEEHICTYTFQTRQLYEPSVEFKNCGKCDWGSTEIGLSSPIPVGPPDQLMQNVAAVDARIHSNSSHRHQYHDVDVAPSQ